MTIKAGDLLSLDNGAIVVVHHCGDHLEAQFLINGAGDKFTNKPIGDSAHKNTTWPLDVKLENVRYLGNINNVLDKL